MIKQQLEMCIVLVSQTQGKGEEKKKTKRHRLYIKH